MEKEFSKIKIEKVTINIYLVRLFVIYHVNGTCDYRFSYDPAHERVKDSPYAGFESSNLKLVKHILALPELALLYSKEKENILKCFNKGLLSTTLSRDMNFLFSSFEKYLPDESRLLLEINGV